MLSLFCGVLGSRKEQLPADVERTLGRASARVKRAHCEGSVDAVTSWPCWSRQPMMLAVGDAVVRSVLLSTWIRPRPVKKGRESLRFSGVPVGKEWIGWGRRRRVMRVVRTVLETMVGVAGGVLVRVWEVLGEVLMIGS